MELSDATPFEHRWLHSESADLLHPAIECDSDGNDLYDYVCGCGVNVVIHHPSCRSLVSARKRVVIRPLLSVDGIHDRWVVCRRHYPTVSEWVASFGSTAQYPSNGKWHPISLGRGGGIIGLPESCSPTDEDTTRVIELIKDAASQHLPSWTYEIERENARQEELHRAELLDMIDDDAGFIAAPGSKGCVSRPLVPNFR